MLEDIKTDATERMQKCIAALPGRPEEAAHRPRRTRACSSTSRSTTTAPKSPLQPGGQHRRRGRAHARRSRPGTSSMVPAIEKAIHKSDLRPDADDGRHGDPHAAAAADRGAPPRPHQGGAPRGARTRASRCATCAATCCSELKEALKEKLISQDDERRAPGRDPEAHRQGTSPISTRCWPTKEKELMQV